MMQSNTFASMAPLLRERKPDIDCDAVIRFLEKYRSGEWIYPAALHRNLRIRISDVYEVLELCVDAGLIEQYLEIYCPNCKRFTGYRFKTLKEIPEEIGCVNCDEVMDDPERHAIVIYRVV